MFFIFLFSVQICHSVTNVSLFVAYVTLPVNFHETIAFPAGVLEITYGKNNRNYPSRGIITFNQKRFLPPATVDTGRSCFQRCLSVIMFRSRV